jgi:hypothetical protein
LSANSPPAKVLTNAAMAMKVNNTRDSFLKGARPSFPAPGPGYMANHRKRVRAT